ncbi:unnamed protein product [Paramecium pentaurelia]|uniref:Uncharacterized protein n=1 Tax=Paramecium pentaurelia TaxID=43138 RepID=A0A8S1SYH4_9CILI|nr:unnamed protein product [Paramecium pentaurelia]
MIPQLDQLCNEYIQLDKLLILKTLYSLQLKTINTSQKQQKVQLKIIRQMKYEYLNMYLKQRQQKTIIDYPNFRLRKVYDDKNIIIISQKYRI